MIGIMNMRNKLKILGRVIVFFIAIQKYNIWVIKAIWNVLFQVNITINTIDDDFGFLAAAIGKTFVLFLKDF
jgi:hypothetical protein